MVNDRVQRLLQMSKEGQPLRRPETIKIKGIDAALTERILNEIVDNSTTVSWDDVIGQEEAKRALKEAIVLPFQRPDLFTGIRKPSKGILLFGPPGTGKTLLAKAAASASPSANCTFFAFSAASLMSKYVGESEMLVKALFAAARQLQPAIIFIDEIDSLLQTRSDQEHEAMRRLKTEFLLQFDGIGAADDERLVVIGATNRPGDLDEAARRRFTKRILVTLPTRGDRKSLLQKLFSSVKHSLHSRDFDKIAGKTEGFSAADLTALASEISLEPIREVDPDELVRSDADEIRPISLKDVDRILSKSKSSIDPRSVQACLQWHQQYGT